MASEGKTEIPLYMCSFGAEQRMTESVTCFTHQKIKLKVNGENCAVA